MGLKALSQVALRRVDAFVEPVRLMRGRIVGAYQRRSTHSLVSTTADNLLRGVWRDTRIALQQSLLRSRIDGRS